MKTDEAYVKLAERSGHPDSEILHRILKKAMSAEEARFLGELPAEPRDLAAKFNMSETAVEDKIKELARRGLVVSSRKGFRFPRDLGTLHDNILASRPEYIPQGIDKLWMEFYESGWWREIADSLTNLGAPALRVIPVLRSTPDSVKLLPHESIRDLIEAHKDLISVRNCCCRVGAKNCDHPVEVCTQFGRRAEYDLYRGSGRKVSADEAVAISMKAGESGLVPTVTNLSMMEALEFICYCCRDACLVLNPIMRAGKVSLALASSRFLVRVDNKLCNGCGDCVPWCPFDAIEMKNIGGESKAVIDADKCVGCGICVLKCGPGAMTMELVRPPDYIPKTIAGPSSIVHT
jgi:Pyruvate/2-oxoacid:ferredoxin oxidoreductase delta subunit